MHSLKGHVYAIYDVAFSPDGQRLASASHDGTVRIWDPSAGTQLKVLQGHASIVNEVAWSPDGKHLVSGSTDKTGRIWSAESGTVEAVLRGHTAEVSAVAWSPDGRSVATGGKDSTVRLFEPSGKPRYTWQRAHNQVESVAFSPDSKTLLYTFASDDDPPVDAAILDMADGRERARYNGHENGVICSVFLPGGGQVATGDSISGIRIWDAASGKTIRRLDGQGKSVFAVGWSPDGQAVAWGNATKPYVERIGPPIERTFCFSRLDFGPPPTNQFVRARPRLGGLQIGSLIEQGRMSSRTAGIERIGGDLVSKFTLPDPNDHLRSYSLLAGNRAVVGTDSRAYVIDALSGEIQQELNDRSGDVWNVVPSPNFRYLLTGTNDQIVRAWNLETGQPLVSLFVAGQEWIAWTPEGYYAASLAGESLMGWHINHGPEQMADFYSASQFHDSLYRPDVIRRVLEMGSVQRALEWADRQRETQSRPLTVANVLPPRVTISEPGESPVDSRQAQLTVHASATAVDEDAVQSMRLIVDGRPLGPAQKMPPPAATPAPPAEADAPVEHSWTVELPPGKHKLQVKAETADSYGLSRPLEVIQQNPAAEPAPDAAEVRPAPQATAPAAIPVPTPPAGKLYVLAIDAQPQAAAPATSGRDARAVVDALAGGGKTPFDEVVTRQLVGPAATPAAVHDELEKLRSQMTLSDTGVIYFAGGDGLDAAGHYVLKGPASPSGAATISTTDVQAQLAATQGRLALVLDLTRAEEQTRRDANAGFCGAAETHEGGSKLDAAAAEWLRELLTEDYGVVVISSRRASAGAPAATAPAAGGSPKPPGAGNSTRTNPAPGTSPPAAKVGAPPTGLSPLVQSFSEALGGKADANHDGTVDFKELAPYLNERVRALTGGKQTPTIERPRGVRSFPLSKAAP